MTTITTVGASSATTRLWNILLTQIGCTDPWRYREGEGGLPEGGEGGIIKNLSLVRHYRALEHPRHPDRLH